jgi:hypothetical protein
VQWAAGAWLISTCPQTFTHYLQLFTQEKRHYSVTNSHEVAEHSVKALEKIMRESPARPVSPTVTIRVSGRLSSGHLTYLDQFVASALDCALWPLLDLTEVEEADRVALAYLTGGEGRDFGILSCPNFIREWVQHEKQRCAA